MTNVPLTQDELAELLRKNLPLVDQRGEVIDEIETNILRMRLPVIDKFLSHDLPPGTGQVVLSGPITLGFADTAMYACVHAFYGRDIFAALVNFNVAFFRVAGRGDLNATVRMLRRGKTLAFVEAHLYSGTQSEPCAHVTATYAVRENKQ